MSEGITDTDRLDFIERNLVDVDYSPHPCRKDTVWELQPFYTGPMGRVNLGGALTLRDAIDQAIDYEREYVKGVFVPSM